MKTRQLVVFISLVGLLSLVVCADQLFGPRIPVYYFVTSGTGQSNEGIPPDPYETFSYDLALLDAGIENFNVVYYTSVLPPESLEIPIYSVAQYFHHGSVLEAILAKAGGVKGQTVVAGVGRVWAVDNYGSYIGGFAAEYEYVYPIWVTEKQAYDEAVAQLTKSLNHELLIRGLHQFGQMTFEVASRSIEQNYGMAIAALGFISFIYPDPYPVNCPVR